MPRSYRNRNDRAGAARRNYLRTVVTTATKTGIFAGVRVTPEDLLQRLARGNTLAHIAANNGKLPQLIEAILTQAGVPVKNDSGKTICDFAADYMRQVLFHKPKTLPVKAKATLKPKIAPVKASPAKASTAAKAPSATAKKGILNGRRPWTIKEAADALFYDVFGGKLPPGV